MSTEQTARSVCVFGPSLFLTITIEQQNDDDQLSQIHLHPGGQAFWIARMLKHLGEAPLLVSPLGGETGRVIESLAPLWGVDLEKVEVEAEPPAYVHDRRSGERIEIARSQPGVLNRHELDDLYGRILEVGIATGTAVITGKQADHDFPLDAFSRLGADLEATDVTVIGDFHGDELDAFLEGGPIHILKLSDEELVTDGILNEAASQGERVAILHEIAARGVRNVVISASEGATVALIEDRVWSAMPPILDAADHRGSGDSMTAGLVVAASRGLDSVATLRLACAAGAANVTRHGLGNVKPGLVEMLAEQVEVHEI